MKTKPIKTDTSFGSIIKSPKKVRDGWEEQLINAIVQGHDPDEELLEGFTDEFTDKEWQW